MNVWQFRRENAVYYLVHRQCRILKILPPLKYNKKFLNFIYKYSNSILDFQLVDNKSVHRWIFGTRSNVKWICIFCLYITVIIIMRWLPHTNNRNVNICCRMQPLIESFHFLHLRCRCCWLLIHIVLKRMQKIPCTTIDLIDPFTEWEITVHGLVFYYWKLNRFHFTCESK